MAISGFEMRSPNGVFFGPGKIGMLEELTARFDRVMLITGRNMARTEKYAFISAALGSRLCSTFRDMPVPPDQIAVSAATDTAERSNPQAIVSFGGSSAIDGAKAVCHRLRWPVHISIPSTYGGSEATHVFAVVAPETGLKEVFVDVECIPSYVIYDPEVTLTLPPYVTACSGMNSLAHCIEAYYCSENMLNRAYCSLGIQLIIRSLPACVGTPTDLSSRSEMMFGSYLAGTAVCNGFIGLHHGMCHFVGPAYGISHGEINSIMLPYVMQYNVDAISGELAAIARVMGLDVQGKTDVEAAQKAIDAIIALEERIGTPRHLRQFEVTRDRFGELARRALRSPAVQNNPKPIRKPEQIIEVLDAAF